VFVVEQNRDAQLRTLLINEGEIDPAQADSVLHYDGTPITARFIAPSASDSRSRKGTRLIREAAPMTYIAKPKLHHPSCRRTRSASRGATTRARISTLCAGCGHDSISAAIIQACFELDLRRIARQAVGHRLLVEDAGLFPRPCHGFNTVHGRMPSVLTGANLANRDLIYLGVSGDGDSASIGSASSRTRSGAA
jgi:hypothetical protein